ncbi:MAG: PAS domain S-box protein, partial [Pseudohongiella sp.]
GKNIWEEFPEAKNTDFANDFTRASESGKTRQRIEYYPPLNTWFDFNIYPVPEGLAVHFRDISDNRAAEERMRLLESSIERLNDLVVITDAQSIDAPEGPRIVYVNDAFVKLSGYAKEEIIGQTPRILQGPDTDKAALTKIRQALENKRTVRVELLNYSRTGDKYWLEVDIAPIFAADGTHTHWVAVQRDISERKVTDNALRLSDERFQLLSRATNDVIWDWDFRSNLVWWNNSMESVFGHDRGHLESGPESWTSRIYPDDLQRVMFNIHKAIEGDEQSWSDEYRFIKADGSVAMVLDRGFIIRDETGTAIRMLGSMVDLSEQRNLEIQLREAQKLEAVGQLTGGVAHDFNNLLTVILGNMEELQDRLHGEPELIRLAEVAISAAERGAELTNGLLAFSRRQALNPKVLDITRSLKTMETLFKRTLPEHIDINVVSAANSWTIQIDPGQLEVALLNLVLNARDAMPDGGKLTIESANAVLDEDYAELNGGIEPGEYLLVSVSDTGAGMAADIQNRAIEPFFTTKEFGKGSGLGLSMVYGFTKQSNGHLKIYSEQGVGTAVKLYFPRTRLAANTDEAQFSETPIRGGTEHILVVEDDELVRDYVTGQLAALGYRVSEADNGPQALETLTRIAPVDLLLTDVVMPGGMTGRQLAEIVVAQYPEVRVLYTSGYTENAIVHHGRLDPGVQLLGKPYSRGDLAMKVRAALGD